MLNKIKIRKARLKDVNGITHLQSLLLKYHAKFDNYWNLRKGAGKIFYKYAKKKIRSPNAAFFVAEHNGRLVGYVYGVIEKRTPIYKSVLFGHFMDAFVLKEYRGTGICKKLTNQILKWFESKGIDYVQLEVDVRNNSGLKVWKNMKFDPFVLRMKRKI